MEDERLLFIFSHLKIWQVYIGAIMLDKMR